MRLVVFNWQDRTHPQAGGAETHLHEIFSRLVRRGHEVTLVVCHYPGAKRTEMLDGMKVVRIGSRNTFNFAALIWWLRQRQRGSYDVVIDDINKIPLMLPLVSSIPVIGIIHHLFGKSIFAEAGPIAGGYVWLAERLIPTVYRRTTMMVVSESTKGECIAEGLPALNLRVIPNGIDSESFPMTVSEKSSIPMIAYFGRLKRYKSVDHVIRALKIVRTSIPDAHLNIIGRGDDESRLRETVTALRLDDAVTFHGYVNDDAKVRLLSAAHVAVNTSQKEGWGITNIEANACGTPVISANSPGLRDSVNNEVSGLLYPYGNIEVLASEIVRVLKDSELRDRLSHGAIEWARSFSWDASALATESLFQEVISDNSGS
ncbi:MAG: glycosyltransferase family 4 protein [Candidatus Kapabacteria bacterium]|nr:glycosyltransferase family 4 protein [Candidatus Kapabacteria bacterium]